MDRSYMFPLTRNRGLRRKGRSVTAPSVAHIEKDSLCEVNLSSNVKPSGLAPAVSPAISLAISPASSREQLTIETQGNQSSNQSGNKVQKPNCYTCVHRHDLIGDAHSSCDVIGPAAFTAAMLFMTGQTELRTSTLHVRGNTHGVRSGWFTWPINYDPVWLEICNMHSEAQS